MKFSQLNLLLPIGLIASQYIVSTPEDSCSSTITGSLREAINTLNMVNDPSSSIVFQFLSGSSETITLACPLPIINSGVMGMGDSSLILIDGTNITTGNRVTINGNSLYPGFAFDSTSLIDSVNGFTIQNLNMTNCISIGDDGTMGSPNGNPGTGGSLNINALSFANMVLENVQITNSIAQGGNGFDATSTGGPAEGGAVYSLMPLIVQGSASFGGSLKKGSPPPTPGTTFGWTLTGTFPVIAPLQLNPTAISDTISFTDSFAILGIPGVSALTVNGSGTVSVSTTATALTSVGIDPFDPAVYQTFGDVSINQGTLNLNGQVTLNEGNFLIPLPVFATQGTFTLQNGTFLTGSGMVLSDFGYTTNILGTIQPNTGSILLFLGNVSLQAGTEITTTVAPGQAATAMFANFITPVPQIDMQFTSLNVNITGNYSSPGVYALVLSESPFLNSFQSITVNNSSNLSNPSVLYSPLSNPNSILLPVGIPFGITPSTNIYLGNQILNSTVLYDPCAGIIVISLLAPGFGGSALAAFFANQASLTNQALGSFITSLNSQVLRKRVSANVVPRTPLAAWDLEKQRLVAQNSNKGESAPPVRPRDQSQDVQSEPQEEKLSPLTVFSPIKKQPLYSISFTPLGQFQTQDSVTTSNAVLPSYRTNTWGGMFGFDYLGLENILVGGAATAAWTELNVGQGGGGQKIWSGFGSIYSSFTFGRFFFNLLATGSYNHSRTVRNFAPLQGETVTIESATPFGITTVYQFETLGLPGGTAYSNYNIYQLVPHVDFNYEINFGSISLVPFLLSDLSISFSGKISETGNNFITLAECNKQLSLNTVSASLISYMLQSEAGLNLFEQIHLKNDQSLIFRQKGSYINRENFPYKLRTKFQGTDTYTQTSIHLPMQHMFGSALEVIYRHKTVSLMATYEGMVGSGYLSHAGYFRTAYDF